MSEKSGYDFTDFRSSEIPKLLADIKKESTSPDKIKCALRTLLIFCSENEYFGQELLDHEVVDALVELFNSSRGKPFKKQISNILVSLSSDGRNENSISDIAIIALGNINSNSNLDVSLQCISGIQSIISSATPSSSSTLPISSTSHFLSVTSSITLLEKINTVLGSSTVKDRGRRDILDSLTQLVGTGAMSEAWEFVTWRQSQERVLKQEGKSPVGSGGDSRNDGGGGGGSGSGDSTACGKIAGKEKESFGESEGDCNRFLKVFEAFAGVLKGISTSGKRSGLVDMAVQNCHRIDGLHLEMYYVTPAKNEFFPSVVRRLRNARVLHVCNENGVTMDCLRKLNGVTVNTVLVSDFQLVARDLQQYDVIVIGGADGCPGKEHIRSYMAQVEAFRSAGGAVLMMHDTVSFRSPTIDSVVRDLQWSGGSQQTFFTSVSLKGDDAVFHTPYALASTLAVESTHAEDWAASNRYTLAEAEGARPFFTANWERRVAKVDTGHSNRATEDERKLITNIVHHLLLQAGK